MNLSDYLEGIALSILGLNPAQAPEFKGKELLVNDMRNVQRQRLVEYATWYSGDSDAMLNLYNVDNMIEFPTEPFYWKNRRSYFWAASARDNEFKRTHCDFAKDMVDTAVLVCGDPTFRVGSEDSKQFIAGMDADGLAQRIIEANDLLSLRRRQGMPMALAQGWGAYKITWNVGVYGKDPVIHYYRAENVRVYRRANRVLGMTFLDWYAGPNGKKYLVAETRAKQADGKGYSMRTDCFVTTGGDQFDDMNIADAGSVPFAMGGGWKDMPCMFAEPCSFYYDPLHGQEGKSVFEGKLDQLDDLDQAFSIASNTVRGGVPTWTFDMDYCERDPKTKRPIMPKTFEKKYVMVSGKKNMMGDSDSSKPIDVTQPDLNISMYDEHILSLERSILNGHLSPATMGLDIEKKSNERDDTVRDVSVTLFTRNHLLKEDGRQMASLMRQALVAKEFLATGQVTMMPEDWDVKVTYDEFSDKSYEARIESLSSVLVNDGISPEMYVDKVYGKALTEDERDREIKWIEENHKNRTQDSGMMGQEGMGPLDMMGGDGSEDSGDSVGSEGPAVLGGLE